MTERREDGRKKSEDRSLKDRNTERRISRKACKVRKVSQNNL